MKFKDSIGIDISKKTIDVVLFSAKASKQFTNDNKGFRELLKWIDKVAQVDLDQIIICFEHTGIYSQPLALFLHENSITFSMVPAIEISTSPVNTR